MAPLERRLCRIVAGDPKSGRSKTFVAPFTSAEEAADSIRRRGWSEIRSVEEQRDEPPGPEPSRDEGPTTSSSPPPVTIAATTIGDLVVKAVGAATNDDDEPAHAGPVFRTDGKWIYVDGPTAKRHPRYIYCWTLSWFVLLWATTPLMILLYSVAIPQKCSIGRRCWFLLEVLQSDQMFLVGLCLLVACGVALLCAVRFARSWTPSGVLLFHALSATTVLLLVTINGFSGWSRGLLVFASIGALSLFYRAIFLMIYPELEDLALRRRISLDDPFAVELLNADPRRRSEP